MESHTCMERLMYVLTLSALIPSQFLWCDKPPSGLNLDYKSCLWFWQHYKWAAVVWGITSSVLKVQLSQQQFVHHKHFWGHLTGTADAISYTFPWTLNVFNWSQVVWDVFALTEREKKYSLGRDSASTKVYNTTAPPSGRAPAKHAKKEAQRRECCPKTTYCNIDRSWKYSKKYLFCTKTKDLGFRKIFSRRQCIKTQ